MTWAPGNFATSATKDHFYAKVKGNGLNRNTVLAHEKCNRDKKDRDPNKQEKEQFKKLYKLIDDRAAKMKAMVKRSNRRVNGTESKRKAPVKVVEKVFGKW